MPVVDVGAGGGGRLEVGRTAQITLEAEAYAWLLEAGYRVPEEVGVAHLDWSPLQRPLAGVDQRSAAVGAGAVDAVIERVNNSEFGVPAFARTVALPGKWVAGETVRCVAQQRASPRKAASLTERPGEPAGPR